MTFGRGRLSVDGLGTRTFGWQAVWASVNCALNKKLIIIINLIISLTHVLF